MLISQRCLLSAGIMLITLVICYYHILAVLPDEFNPTSFKKLQMKNILLWNGYDRVEMNILLGGFLDHSCSFSNCWVTSDRNYLESLGKFDAIVFNMAVLNYLETNKLPPSNERRFHQYYIFFTQESAFYHAENVIDYKGYFNWTMSYLPDSDIVYPYGRAEASNVTLQYQNKDIKKRKLVAWFASHCSTQSKREKYVKELQKYIDVDIYGLCGPLKCGWNESTGNSLPECYQALQQDYKFYLSFENSLCKDYATEKLYSILKLFVVPVVMGLANYSAIAPPHSFINALQYSPKELANYLLMLDSNDTLYNRYFDWKTNYTIRSSYQEMGREAKCSLCTKLNNRQYSIVDLSSAWNPITRCFNPNYVKPFRRIGI